MCVLALRRRPQPDGPNTDAHSSLRSPADAPDGNTKFTTFEVDTRTVNKPLVRVKLYVDGEEAWRVDVLGKPLARKLALPATAVGSLGKGLRELLSFLRRSFF